eukprot:TRINITY_DN52964_c0_g1_i1.p1 TRINITY_DN52964_c0_g1~~TRINITY_DN52964_c0_g1_i1.p1  ORF type:complete len:101 (+),score=3.92 TRINITY_DN52964_c0_g1_i1:125-427(+)
MDETKVELEDKDAPREVLLQQRDDSSEEPRKIRLQNGKWVPRINERGVEEEFATNFIRTSKYTPLTFPFLNLYEQLSRPAKIGRAVQQECRDRSRMPSSA